VHLWVLCRYKILFLDVLFPLDVKRVIFVDADQTVRGDLWELMQMDLHGAPYGYTPFCSDRKDMDEFRFWKKGYWENHLQGLPYHISALYVIDLVRFRQLAAGDLLRQSYHQLSSDPGSLANLDQDLPNNLQHQLPIFSLPQEWLWCETWCSDKSKKKAKTIDLVCLAAAQAVLLVSYVYPRSSPSPSSPPRPLVQQPAHKGAEARGGQAHCGRVDGAGRRGARDPRQGRPGEGHGRQGKGPRRVIARKEL
jgi:hypothetical protein